MPNLENEGRRLAGKKASASKRVIAETSTDANRERSYDGSTLEECDQRWVKVPGGFGVPHSKLRHKFGLFRAVLNGEVMAIGIAISRYGGLGKRLSQFRCQSKGARKHTSGAYIHDNLDTLELEVLITGPNTKAAADLAKQLKEPMIARHKPRHNAPRSVRQTIRPA